MILNGGHLYVDNSVFESNVGANDTDSSGIAVLGGRLGCASTSCLAVCTDCRDADVDDDTALVASHAPKPQPDATKSTLLIIATSAASVLAFTCIVVVVSRIIRCGKRMADGANNMVYRPMQQASGFELPRSLMECAEDPQSNSEDLEMIQVQLISDMMGESPAPIFAVDRDRIILFWSPGASAADLVVARSSGPV